MWFSVFFFSSNESQPVDASSVHCQTLPKFRFPNCWFRLFALLAGFGGKAFCCIVAGNPNELTPVGAVDWCCCIVGILPNGAAPGAVWYCIGMPAPYVRLPIGTVFNGLAAIICGTNWLFAGWWLNWPMGGAWPYSASILSLVSLAFSFSVGIWLKKSCSSCANDVSLFSFVGFDVTDGVAFDAIAPFFSLAFELIGPLRKQLKTSLCSAVAFLLSTVAVGAAVGDDNPSKSELNKFESLAEVLFSLDVELLLITARDDVFGLLELFCEWNEMTRQMNAWICAWILPWLHMRLSVDLPLASAMGLESVSISMKWPSSLYQQVYHCLLSSMQCPNPSSFAFVFPFLLRFLCPSWPSPGAVEPIHVQRTFCARIWREWNSPALNRLVDDESRRAIGLRRQHGHVNCPFAAVKPLVRASMNPNWLTWRGICARQDYDECQRIVCTEIHPSSMMPTEDLWRVKNVYEYGLGGLWIKNRVAKGIAWSRANGTRQPFAWTTRWHSFSLANECLAIFCAPIKYK